MVIKAWIATEILEQNSFEEVTVFVVMPPPHQTSPVPKAKECTAIFQFQDKEHPSTKGWGFECEGEIYVDPTDKIDVINITNKKIC